MDYFHRVLPRGGKKLVEERYGSEHMYMCNITYLKQWWEQVSGGQFYCSAGREITRTNQCRENPAYI